MLNLSGTLICQDLINNINILILQKNSLNNLVSQPTADCLEIPNSRARGSFRCRSHSPLPSHIRVSLYGISLIVAVQLLTCLVARIKQLRSCSIASRPGCTLCSQSAYREFFLGHSKRFFYYPCESF